jgi:hypothetical protein
MASPRSAWPRLVRRVQRRVLRHRVSLSLAPGELVEPFLEHRELLFEALEVIAPGLLRQNVEFVGDPLEAVSSLAENSLERLDLFLAAAQSGKRVVDRDPIGRPACEDGVELLPERMDLLCGSGQGTIGADVVRGASPLTEYGAQAQRHAVETAKGCRPEQVLIFNNRHVRALL